MRKIILFIFLQFFIVTTFIGCSKPSSISFSTLDLNNNLVNESLFSSNDVTIVVYWAVYCPYCINEMPLLEEWAANLPNNVSMVGVVSRIQKIEDDRIVMATDETIKAASAIIDEQNVTYQNIVSNDEFQDALGIEISWFPTVFFVNGTGEIIENSMFNGNNLDVAKENLSEYLNKGYIAKRDIEGDEPTPQYRYDVGDRITLENGETIICLIDENNEMFGLLEEAVAYYYSSIASLTTDEDRAQFNSYIEKYVRDIPKK